MGSGPPFESPQLKARLDDSGDGIVISLAGELDMAAAPSLFDWIAAAAAWDRSVILDLAELTYCDSAGLGVLIRCHLAAESAGGRFALRHPGEQTRLLLSLTDLDSHFEVEP